MRAFSRSARGAAGAVALTCGMGLLMRLDALVNQGNSRLAPAGSCSDISPI